MGAKPAAAGRAARACSRSAIERKPGRATSSRPALGADPGGGARQPRSDPEPGGA
jgi:hypothetical protein